MRTKKLKNKRMNAECYKLRRKVMDVIYQIKTTTELPRITVRITETPQNRILGLAQTGDNIIWITENCVNMSHSILRHVVVHEIGHAVFGLPHDETCPVMRPVVDKPATDSQIEAFLKDVSA